ncbi:MAG TPA: hypothetical protein VG815_20395, partial [Chloroflexota bacterium]|nr:hypothetical protein [Chloroflexota bacterium]
MGLAALTAVLLEVGRTIGPGGDVLVIGGAVIALWRAPALRSRLAELLHLASTRRWLDRALLACGMVGPHGHRPAVRKVETLPCGFRFTVLVPLG